MTNDECRKSNVARLAAASTRRAIAAIALALLTSGCAREIETTYGQRTGPQASSSVNGTAVLGEMFEQAGAKVFSWHVLSPRLQERADCIVWFPNDFQPPSHKVCSWFDAWLRRKPGRTLIYVGRDFDAAPTYWEKIEPEAPPEQQAEVRRRLAEARARFEEARGIAQLQECEWFSLEGNRPLRKVRTLAGEPQWLEGIDPARLDIELRSRLVPTSSAKVLLSSQGDMLVSSEYRDEGQLVLVANGSFLLNLPLVNHEHRKLAGKLIDQVDPAGQTVVFLESYPGGPRISEEDPAAGVPTGLELLLEKPIVWIFLHLALVGVMFCFSRWPIFGLAGELEQPSSSDFGKHIQAVGELLERSDDRSYAMTRIVRWQQTTAP